MKIKRDEVLKLVNSLPAEFHADDLVWRLYLLQKMAAAEADIAAGRGIPVDEVRKRVAEWGK